MIDFDQLFQQFTACRVAVIGDVMLDTYWWGKVERISPEAPVPIVSLDKKEKRIGGAGNVALNTVSLGAPTTVFSVVGDDDDGSVLNNLMQQSGIDTSGLIRSKDRITSNKTRIIGRSQQMMRLDAEITTDLSEHDASSLIEAFSAYVKNNKPAVVIFEDYNKGVLPPKVIEQVVKICQENKIVTTVDPKRKNFFAYKDVDIFKPNLSEVKDGLNLLIDDIDEDLMNKIHVQLQSILNHNISLITLSEKGVYYRQNDQKKIIPSHIRNVADVSGAGDTVIGVASLVYASTNNIYLAAEMANIAGGLVCEEVGTAAINKEKLLYECKTLLV